MSAASKALRRQFEVAALFGEAQGKGTEWLGPSYRFGRGRPGLAQDFRAARAGWRAWHEARLQVVKARHEAVADAVWAGEPPRRVAERFGLSLDYVYRLASRERVRLRPSPPPDRDDTILALLALGLGAREVGRRVDASEWVVYHVAHKRGVYLGLKGRLGRKQTPGRYEAIVEALASGLRPREVAERLGLGLRTVQHYATRARAEGRLDRARRRAGREDAVVRACGRGLPTGARKGAGAGVRGTSTPGADRADPTARGRAGATSRASTEAPPAPATRAA